MRWTANMNVVTFTALSTPIASSRRHAARALARCRSIASAATQGSTAEARTVSTPATFAP